MDTWATFWGILLLAGLVLFAGLAVVVLVGGFFDVKAMFRRIRKQHEKPDPDPDVS